MNTAWRSPDKRLITVTGWGGIGKTSLVKLWLQQCAGDSSPAFGWSFYSQGSGDMAASTDVFFKSALEFYGEQDSGKLTVAEKAQLLAALIEEKDGIFILDGLEPLQYTDGPLKGAIKDPGIKILVAALNNARRGLGVITSRFKIKDLATLFPANFVSITLQNLDQRSSIKVIRQFEIKGPEDSFKEAVKYFEGHALSLVLLANLLYREHNGDITRFREITFWNGSKETSTPAVKMMSGYDRLLTPQQLQFVRLLGFFNRPATLAEIGALLQEPAVTGLNDLLQAVAHNGSTVKITSDLRDSFLLQPIQGAEEEEIDTHPMIREYQQSKLKENSGSWIEGNKRLFYHISNNISPQPETSFGIIQLYTAAQHGCRANLHEQVFEELFEQRIWRRDRYFSTNELGLLNDELEVLVHFFSIPFDVPHPNLPDRLHGRLYTQVALCLKGSLRLKESVVPYEKATAFREANKQYQDAVINACNLCQINLYLGNLSKAKTNGQKAIHYSNQQTDLLPVWRTAPFSNLATVLMECNEMEAAQQHFTDAIRLLAKIEPDAKHLYSSRGVQYAEFLLAKYEPVIWNAWLNNQSTPLAADWYTEILSVIAYGLEKSLKIIFLQGMYHLVKVKVQIFRLASGEHTINARDIEITLDNAEKNLISSRMEYELPRVYIAKALLYACLGRINHTPSQFSKALMELDRAEKIVDYAKLNLYKLQLCLTRLKVLLIMKDMPAKKIEMEINQAARLIDRFGYARYATQLKDLTSAAKTSLTE